MNNLLPLLYLTFRTLHKSSLWSKSIKISCLCKAPPYLRYPARCLIYGNDITRYDLLLLYRLDHLRAQLINRLHIRCLQRDLPALGVVVRGFLNLDLQDLALDYLGLFLYSYAD